MFSIKGFLMRESKCPTNQKHLSQIGRYQIHSLMNTQHNITQIARPLGRDQSTISRELQRYDKRQFYPTKQVWEVACKRGA